MRKKLQKKADMMGSLKEITFATVSKPTRKVQTPKKGG